MSGLSVYDNNEAPRYKNKILFYIAYFNKYHSCFLWGSTFDGHCKSRQMIDPVKAVMG
jgi:hypothetical protein